jgi:hypothetical protein
MKKLLSLITAIGLGLTVSVNAQYQQQQQQPTDEQSPAKGKSSEQTTNQPAGPSSGHSDRESMKDTSKPAKMKSGGTATTGKGQTTTVNKQEFRSRHSEVFSLGRHPKEFFVQRYGESHFRLIGNTYFVFVDGCWVAVDVDGFTYTQRVICAGEPDYIVVE